MLLSPPGLATWVLANIAAALSFLYFASITWLEPNLRGEEVARSGDVLIWAISALPILAASLVANLIWLVLVALQRARIGA